MIGTGCHIGEGSVIKSFSHIEGRGWGMLVQLAPMHACVGNKSAEGVKIGNFVETKNVSLGDGAKASHLTYLGDAERCSCKYWSRNHHL